MSYCLTFKLHFLVPRSNNGKCKFLRHFYTINFNLNGSKIKTQCAPPTSCKSKFIKTRITLGSSLILFYEPYNKLFKPFKRNIYSTIFKMDENKQPSIQNIKGQVVVYSILGCPHCMRAKKSLREMGLPFKDIRLDLYPHIKDEVMKRSGMRTVPQIYFNERLIGGNDNLTQLLHNKEQLEEALNQVVNNLCPADAHVIPDPNSAVSDADPFNFKCEPDEYFLLVNEMKKDNLIRTNWSFLKSQKNSFSGKDFLNWVVEKKGLDESKAIEMGQALLDRRFVKSQNHNPQFSVGQDLFVLIEDDETDALNNGPVSDCLPKTANEVGELLRKMVLNLYSVFLSQDGKAVDYEGIKASEEFQLYKTMTRELIRVDIENSTREEKLAFFINIYNALVIHANIERGPPTNLWGRYKFFNSTRYIISGHAYSLQDIENGVLRANRKGVGQISNPFNKDDPRLKVALTRHEPLIHFALVCGAKSCPPIKTYTAQNIYSELQMSAAAFLDSDEACQVDLKSNTIKLSAIFKWFQVDFGKNKKEVVEFVSCHMGEGQKLDDLKQVMETNNYKVVYLDYDWTLNSKV
ncbi:uncharacterized protein LOC131953421 isoform X1 [Physella acuta]|uniref:uncharacterized protein LOC131953421 isoform X1 n=1 Tax=Physella acuta TaxID=109671 RepID=UPI0027DE9C37|nr:uncharacterized protein LOC131953421 isoform X1 [Physella acuta]